MAKINFLKEVFIQIAFLAAFLLVSSCNNTQRQEDSKEVAEDHNDAKFVNNQDERDAQFLVNAAENNLEEIQLGQLAQQMGGSSDVKELGKIMEVAHNKSLADLNALAQSKMITLPASLTDNAIGAYKSLNEKSGIDFDKAYADKMVSVHKDAIAAFEKASTDSTDSEIRNWAKTSLPDLRKHLDLAMDCQKKCNNL